MITCPICDKQFSQLTNSHLKTHGHTTDSFRVEFPDASLVSIDIKHKNKNNGDVGRSKSTLVKKEQSAKRKLAHENNPTRCEQCNISLPYDQRNNRFCSHNCAGVHSNATRDYQHTDETKQKIRAGVMKNPAGVYKQHLERTWTPHCTPSPTFPNISKQILGPYTKVRQCQVCCKTFATTTRNTCSNECYLQTRRGGGLQPNSTIKHRSVYKAQQMDSGAELAFAKLLDTHRVEWFKNTTTFFTFHYPSGKMGKYYPDFYLPKYNAWVEIKGKRYYRVDDPIRWAAVPNLEIIYSHQIRLPAVCTGNAPVLQQ